ncbi:RNA polymerase factor sigma-54 [Mangrovibrevibacter kandeliae]|uniref:RNA polymerase factor sigma-54 n=1 Tax=Mangrovibrevibacter kandeliae TaxID=2968473 RepID=UPI0021188468|nr:MULTISPECIES: RNA polymerase factor sigma-54 [unclassified Aurantimonas]MCQ8782202.1 RNA polymerase factor sigma-54 [Aurantimonas sp. CSK15Z-1]MCW4115149.1 RNA polymerase factor sigma-54 [Aurantimonas sp. MSK8Z-1]
MLSPRLQLRQSQSLVMTPQLLQSIRLLQFSHLELQSFVAAEVERNPLLDLDEMPQERSVGVAEAEAEPVGARSEADLHPFSGREAKPSPSSAAGPGVGTASGRYDGSVIEAVADRRPSLVAHAEAEIGLLLREASDRDFARMLLAHVDEAGYLTSEVDVIAAQAQVAPAHAAAVLTALQEEIEPAGLFARSLTECLALQLKRRGRLDPVIGVVLDNLELLAKRDFAALRRLTGEDERELMEILEEIRGLDPKPGHGFADAESEPVVPDVLVTAAADGTWQVELNPATLPRVLVHRDYCDLIGQGRISSAERGFLTECQQSASWLTRSLDQRARTILKVAGEIIRRQGGFLEHGIAHLKPLTLMAVADAVGMHESTISRVTANKYMATPRGVFELKFFFTVAIASSRGGEAHSAESVKHRIRCLIDAESVDAVLSDDDIADRLKREGVDLARRTVAKYREALGIPSSVQRRREMNARRLAS